ncbi:MAG TPA: MFS transporter [Edaphobacter sp.]|nr:MFS transporter [Edaphobacter sp.]
MASNPIQTRTALMLTMNACMFIFGIVLFLMGSLLPSLNVSNEHAGSLGSIPLIGILIATVVVGPILDMKGAKQILIIGLLMIAGALVLIPSLRVYWQLELCCLVYGFGGGILNTSTNVLVADLNAQSRARALNLLGCFFSAGGVFAPILMSFVGEWLSPWVVLRIFAGLTAAVLVPVVAFQFPPPLQAGVRFRNSFAVLNQPIVWLFGILLAFELASENCMFVWTSKIVVEVLHTTPAQGGLALAGLGTALGVGRLIAGIWLRWFGNLGTIWASVSMVLAGILIAVTARNFIAMLSAMMLIGLGLSAIFPTILGIAGDRFSGETGTVFGGIIAVGLCGGAAGPKLGAVAIGFSAIHVLWIPATCAVVIGAITILFAMQKRAAKKVHA